MQQLRTCLQNLKSNLLFLAAAGLFLVLLSGGKLSALPAPVWCVAAFLFLCLAAICPRLMPRRAPLRAHIFPAAAAAVCGGLAAFDSYLALPMHADWLVFISKYDLHDRAWEIVILVLLAAVAFFVCFCVFSRLAQKPLPVPSLQGAAAQSRKTDLCIWLYCLVLATLVLTICTKSSPLYALNDWVDSNCFFTVGKAMANGKVLYRDIYEQKGPLLYFLHGLAYRISSKTFFGVYLLEILAGSFFLFFGCKTVRLHSGKSVYFWMPFLAATLYTSEGFSHGDSAEELCLPFFAACLFLAERAFTQKRDISLREWIIVGVLGGCVLFIKFNLLGFFIGWALVPFWLLLRARNFKGLCKALLCIVTGVLLTAIPVLVYFISTHALGDFLKGYFYNNIFLYGGLEQNGAAFSATWLRTMFERLQYVVLHNYTYLLPACFGILWYASHARGARRLYVPLIAAGTFLTVFSGANAFTYYAFALGALGFFALFPLCALTDRLFPKNYKKTGLVLIVFAMLSSTVLSYLFSSNTYAMTMEKEEFPQYRFANIICSIENPTLLNYGFLDGGFYTTTGIIPSEKYFCQLNLVLPDMYTAQALAVRNAKTDFVVTRGRTLNFGPYTCVDSATVFFEGKDRTYYLYAANRVIPELAENGALQGETAEPSA